MGKLATSPLPYWGSPPLQSGGQNQKWPTSGQIGYLTPAVSGSPTASEMGAKSEVAHKWANWLPPAVSGSPTASERGAKSEVAHKWANWLPHPCRIGEPHRLRDGGKIRSGPQVGKLATSPLPYWGSPPLQSGGQNQKWPTSGQIGYLTPAVSGSPTASEMGAKSEVAHKWANWLPPAVSGSPTASERGAKSEVAHKWANWLPHPCRIGEPHRLRDGGKIRSGPQVGKLATSPLPYWGSPPLQSGGQNQKWPTSGQIGYLTPAVSGSPTASERWGQNQKWPTSGQIGYGYLTPAVSGSPTASERGQNQKWPTSGQIGYLTPAVSGIPTASERGAKSERWPTSGQIGYLTPAVSGSPTTSERGAKSEVAHKWANWLPSLGIPTAVLGIPTASEMGAKSEVAHKWANWLPHPCRMGIPTNSERGAKSEVAHKWANWLPHPCRIGDPHRCRAGGKIRSGPQVGKLATSPLPYWGSPPLAVSGIPTAERGAKSEVAHKWANWLPHPCRIGDPHRFRAGGKIRSGPQVGKLATSPLPYRGAPPLQSGGQNQKWPTSGQIGYLTPAVSGIPTAAERPTRGKLANQRRGQNQKWPTSGQIGYLTPAVSGIPTAAERGAKSEVAHKWANWLPHPCRIGDPHRCKIRSGPQVGKLATSPLPYQGAPPLQSKLGAKSEVAHKWANWLPHPCRIGDPHRFRAAHKGQNQKWPTSGQIGYLTPAVSGIPTT